MADDGGPARQAEEDVVFDSVEELPRQVLDRDKPWIAQAHLELDPEADILAAKASEHVVIAVADRFGEEGLEELGADVPLPIFDRMKTGRVEIAEESLLPASLHESLEVFGCPFNLLSDRRHHEGRFGLSGRGIDETDHETAPGSDVEAQEEIEIVHKLPISSLSAVPARHSQP
ncbi:MAG TPA: hypothetical protein VF179_01775 [Thermoanaerobaculia bacterium]|nr:hypothetical protein [Thermoanaerobaculia bacterium]